ELAVRSILQHQLESAGCAQTENGRQAEAEDNRTLELREFRLNGPQDRLLIEVQRVPLVPRLEQRNDRRDIRVDGVRQAIDTTERGDRFDAGGRPQDVLDLTD